MILITTNLFRRKRSKSVVRSKLGKSTVTRTKAKSDFQIENLDSSNPRLICTWKQSELCILKQQNINKSKTVLHIIFRFGRPLYYCEYSHQVCMKCRLDGFLLSLILIYKPRANIRNRRSHKSSFKMNSFSLT